MYFLACTYLSAVCNKKSEMNGFFSVFIFVTVFLSLLFLHCETCYIDTLQDRYQRHWVMFNINAAIFHIENFHFPLTETQNTVHTTVQQTIPSRHWNLFLFHSFVAWTCLHKNIFFCSLFLRLFFYFMFLRFFLLWLFDNVVYYKNLSSNFLFMLPFWLNWNLTFVTTLLWVSEQIRFDRKSEWNSLVNFIWCDHKALNEE